MTDPRLERLDARHQIRQLAVRYAAAMQVRDGETLAGLYVDDVRVPGGLTGRSALREAYFGPGLDRLDISALHPGTHVITLDPARPERASGSVYTLGAIKTEGRWIRQAICYFDRYAKRGDDWFFISRDHQLFFGVDHDQRPNHLPPANWPASDTGTGTLPYAFPTWES
jgi:hypothetical protein